jgi:hypothetical protein
MGLISVHLLKRRVVLDYLHIFRQDQQHRAGERMNADSPFPPTWTFLRCYLISLTFGLLFRRSALIMIVFTVDKRKLLRRCGGKACRRREATPVVFILFLTRV